MKKINCSVRDFNLDVNSKGTVSRTWRSSGKKFGRDYSNPIVKVIL